MKCNNRKTILKEKRKEQAARDKLTYSEATQVRGSQPQSIQSLTPYQRTLKLTREDSLKINICVTHVHYRNIENPGSNADELNIILAENNLLNIIIPENRNSHKIFNLATEKQNNTNITIPETMSRKSKYRKDCTGRGKGQQEEVSIDKEIQSMEQEILPKEAQETGLHFFYNERLGLATG